jgi:chromosomal replication initiation ATPase DnaA
MQPIKASFFSPAKGSRAPSQVFCDLAIAAAAAVFDAPCSKLLAETRGKARVAFARHLAIYLQHVALGASLSSCARLFGRDRASVRHACARIEDARDDPRFDAMLARLEYALRAQADMLLVFANAFAVNAEGGDDE